MSINQRFHDLARRFKLKGPMRRATRKSIEYSEKDKPTENQGPEVQVDRLSILPPELIFYLANYLTEIECWCLALTCKSTYLLLTQECKIPLIKDKEQLYELLLLLETDLPSFIACQPSSHLRPRGQPFLHRWHIDQTRPPDSKATLTLHQVGCRDSSFAAQSEGLRCHNPPSPDKQPEPPKWYVSEEIRRLILRHEVLGPNYGVPVSILDYQAHSDEKGAAAAIASASPSSSSSTSSLPPSWKTKITSKITSNGNLMVRRYTSYQTKIFDARNPYRIPDAEQLRQCLCRHITWDLAILLFRFMIKLLYTHRDNATNSSQPSALWPSVNRPRYPNYPKNWIHHPRLLKCQVCATDFYCKSKVRIRSPAATAAALKLSNSGNGGGDASAENVGTLATATSIKVGNGEVEYWSEVVFDVYHDLGGLRVPPTLAQKKVVREMPGHEALTTAEADERLREALELRWLGRQRSWKDNISKHSPRVMQGDPADYTADGVYVRQGVPEDVCFLRTRRGLRLDAAARGEALWMANSPPAQTAGGST